MKPALLSCLLLLLASEASAHRLDEYLQATRISVATNRIDLSIYLTPGVAVADRLLAIIDKNRDGQISGGERAAYLQRVLRDIKVELDETALALSPTNTSFPTVGEVKAGVGVIRIKATAAIGQLSVGNHTLKLTNAHLPTISVYLVNALTPNHPAIQIMKQARDELQQNYRLEFGVSPSRP